MFKYLSMTLCESSFSLIDSAAFTMPCKQDAIIGATDDSISAESFMNSLKLLVLFSSSSCSLLNTWKFFLNIYNKIKLYNLKNLRRASTLQNAGVVNG